MTIQLYLGDCIDEMKKIDDNSIDLIATDLPYGTTKNKWDIIIPFDDMWREFNRICKDDANMVFTASQPFTSLLITSNIKNFRYEIIWNKTLGSGQLNINRQPLKMHESIIIFHRKFRTYNEQKTTGEPYKISRKLKKYGPSNYSGQEDHICVNAGERRAKSVITIPNPRVKGGHPTQKPVELMDYIIKTYSSEGDIVLDPTMGSGTTGVSAIKNNRQFIGIEKDILYFSVAQDRLNQSIKELYRNVFNRL